jgi:hypothetical protein
VAAFLEELDRSERESSLELASTRRFARGVAIFRAGDDRGIVIVACDRSPQLVDKPIRHTTLGGADQQ